MAFNLAHDLCDRHSLAPGVQFSLLEIRRFEPDQRPVRGPAGASFWERRPRRMGGRPAKNLDLLREQPDAFLRFPQLERVSLSHTKPQAVFDVRDLQPSLQARLGYPEVFRDSTDRGFALPGNRDHVATELFRQCCWHVDHLSVRTEILTGS